MNNDPVNIGPGIRIPRPGPSVKKAARFGCGFVGLSVIVIFFLAALGPYTNYLWFLHDARHPEVVTTAYGTRGQLFAFAFFPAWALLHFSLRRALSLSMVYMQTAASFSQAVVTAIVRWVQTSGYDAVRYVAPALAFFSAMGISGEWSTMLLARHAQPFGVVDPIFHRDLSFFVFTLPWYRALVNFSVGLFVLTTLVTLGIYVGLQALAIVAKIELNRPQVRVHLGLLLGGTLILLGMQTWLKCYEYGTIDGTQFVGAGYTASMQLVVQQVLAGLLVLAGIGAIVGARTGRPYQLVAWGVGSCVAVFLIGLVAFPAILQRLYVEPNKLSVEGPYAARAIKMTRFAYGLDKIEDRDFDVQTAPSAADVAASQTTLDNMRLWDPEVLRQALDGLQGIKPYYTFNDVDIDRYVVGGKPRMVMLAPRDTTLAGLADSSRTWVNERLQYTHGIGVTISPVNETSSNGWPQFFAHDLPQLTTPDFKIDEPRLYFSDFRGPNNEPDEEYVLVDTKVDEFDYPAGETPKTTRWTGGRGIPVGGPMAKLAFSIVLGDGNLLVTPNVTSKSRLLRHRNIRERASLVLPFLKFDRDPYIVVLDGKLIWLMDAYTVSDSIPYAARAAGPGGTVNYIRNSVKVTVDAYTGEVNAYAIDPNEPILKAYREIYPTLIKDVSALPKGLREHFRYPEDLMDLQTYQLQVYHVSDPTIFLNNGDAWQLPLERGLSGSMDLMPPYYVMMKLPDEPTEGFMLILPFTPNQKGTLSGWMAAHCDPANYGKLVLYRYPQGSPLNGAAMEESTFNQDPAVSYINRQFSNDQSQIIVGNLLVVPIGKSVMYVEPLFLKSKTAGLQAAPELKKVLLGINGKIVVGDTYTEALDKLFGKNAAVPSPTTGAAPPSNSTATGASKLTTAPAAVKEALGLLDQADAALRAGDFAKYGELQKQARAKLRALSGG